MMNYIDPSVKISDGVEIGYFTVIEKDVMLGKGTIIGNNVTIWAGTMIGDDVQIGDGCVIGKQPKPSKTSTVKYDNVLPPLIICNSVTVGANAVLYAGTQIGDNSLVADLASVREKCIVGNYVVIGRGVAVENSTTIGDYTKIQTGAYITAYMNIEDHVFVAPMVTFTNDNFMGRTEKRFQYIKGATVRRGSRIGGGAIVLPGIDIAEETFVAAGALVTKNTEERKVVMGFPAKEIRGVPDKELVENQGAKK